MYAGNNNNNNNPQLLQININNNVRLTISPSNAEHQIKIEVSNIIINGGGFILGSGSTLNDYVNDSGHDTLMGQVDVDDILHN